MNIIDSESIALESKVAIVVVRVNKMINNNLLKGAIDSLKIVGCVNDKNITVVWIPDIYGLPTITNLLAVSGKYDAVVALGTIINGYNSHFEFIGKKCSYELLNISIKNMLPVGLGLLITDTVHQAIEYSNVKNNNRGSEAALFVLEMINVVKIIKTQNSI